MADMIEPEIDRLHGQVVNDDSELPVGGGEMTDQPDQGDEESNPELLDTTRVEGDDG